MSDHLQLIPDKQIQRGDKIGEGGFGEVYKGSWQGYQVAIKTLRLKQLSDELREEFNREAKVMAKLNHPGVIRMYGVCMEPGKYAMLMELMPRGDLYHLLSNQKQTLSWGLRWQLAIDIGSGLSYLHANKILHRDLKSMNVLLDDKLRAKITDFGLAKLKVHSRSIYTNKSGGSMPWMAPELFGRSIKLSPAADVYAYGMVLWEIVSRKIPFSDANNPQQIMAWVSQGETEDIPKDCPEMYGKVIEQCWKGNPEERSTAKSALELLQKARPQKSEGKTPQISRWSGQPTLSSSSMVGGSPLPNTMILSPPSVKTNPLDQKKLDQETTWQCLQTLKAHDHYSIFTLAYLGEDRLASGYDDGTIKIWDIRTGKYIKTLKGHSKAVSTLVDLGQGLIASGSEDKKIKIWDTQAGKCLKTLKGHKGSVVALVRLIESRIASGSHDETIKIWNIKASKCLQTIKGHGGKVYDLVSLNDLNIVSSSGDKSIRIWNAQTGIFLKILAVDDFVTTSLALLDNQTIAGGVDREIKIWDTQTGKCLKTLKERHRNTVVALAYLGKDIIASGSHDETIKIWNIKTGKCLQTLKGHNSMVNTLVHLGENKLASGSWDATIKIWGKK